MPMRWPKRKMLPETVYVTWSDEPNLYRLRYLDAVASNPESNFQYPTKYTAVVGVYKLVDFITIPPAMLADPPKKKRKL